MKKEQIGKKIMRRLMTTVLMIAVLVICGSIMLHDFVVARATEITPVEGDVAGENQSITKYGLTITVLGGNAIYAEGSGFTLEAGGTYTVAGTWDPKDAQGNAIGGITGAFFGGDKSVILVAPLNTDPNNGIGTTTNVTLAKVTIDLSAGASVSNLVGKSYVSAFEVEENFKGDVNVILSGASVLKSGVSCAGVQKNVTMQGIDSGVGKLTISEDTTNDIAISDELTASGGSGGAGIGGAVDESTDSITIIGGTISATGDGGAGIGGGSIGDGSNITIEGGNITAASGDSAGAGIGGGMNAIGKNIVISGGFVHAVGGRKGGAGIGGGNDTGSSQHGYENVADGDGTDILISGGVVYASGGANGAGIGGGDYGNGKNITINGDAIVFATADSQASAIGAGRNGSAEGNSAIKGIVFENNVGTVYGQVTLPSDLEISAGYVLAIPAEKSMIVPVDRTLKLIEGASLTNDGLLENFGTVDNQGTVTNNGIIRNYGTWTGNAPTGNKLVQIYALTVLNGTASIEGMGTVDRAVEGALIIITADAPAAGQVFNGWQVDAAFTAAILDSAAATETTFTMPAGEVRITASYRTQSSGGEIIPPISHNHSYSSYVSAEPSCTQAGMRTYYCSCGSSYTEGIFALSHSYASSVTKQATESEEGVRSFTCSRCGDAYTETIAKLEAKATPTVNPTPTERPAPTAEPTKSPKEPTPVPTKEPGAQATPTTSPQGPEPTKAPGGDTAPTSVPQEPEPSQMPETDKPMLAGDNNGQGWTDIENRLKDAEDGESIIIEMNDTTTVPKSVIENIKGKDIIIVLDMGDGMTWTINGKDISGTVGDVNFGISTDSSGIPVEVINNITGERSYIVVSLEYEGEFGFTATLTINLEVKNAGLIANLFYYNEAQGNLEFVCASPIDADGNAQLGFTHASDYTVIIDDHSLENEEKQTGDFEQIPDSDKPDEGVVTPALGTDDRTQDTQSVDTDGEESQNSTLIIVICVLAVFVIAGVCVIWQLKRKKK